MLDLEKHFEAFQKALLDAFSLDELEHLVQFELGENLNDIADQNKTRTSKVFELLKWCKRQNKIDDLLAGAVERRPNSQALKVLMRESSGGRSEVRVHHIKSPDHQYFDETMRLYEDRIPEERVPPGDIARWVNSNPDESVLLVAEKNNQVVGLMFFHVYAELTTPLAFISYLVVLRAESQDVSKILGKSFLDRVYTELGQEARIFFEVDRPGSAGGAKQQAVEAVARIRVFDLLASSQKLILSALDVDYVQPSLYLDPEDEQPMYLMMLEKRDQTSGFLKSDEVKAILDFVYRSLYPDEYSANAREQKQFEEYCSSLLERKTADLPEDVPTLTYKQIYQIFRKTNKLNNYRS